MTLDSPLAGRARGASPRRKLLLLLLRAREPGAWVGRDGPTERAEARRKQRRGSNGAWEYAPRADARQPVAAPRRAAFGFLAAGIRWIRQHLVTPQSPVHWTGGIVIITKLITPPTPSTTTSSSILLRLLAARVELVFYQWTTLAWVF